MSGFIVVASPVLRNSDSFQLPIANKSVQNPDFTRFGTRQRDLLKKPVRDSGVIEHSFLRKLLFMESITIVVWPIYQPGNEYGLRAYKAWPSIA